MIVRINEMEYHVEDVRIRCRADPMPPYFGRSPVFSLPPLICELEMRGLVPTGLGSLERLIDLTHTGNSTTIMIENGLHQDVYVNARLIHYQVRQVPPIIQINCLFECPFSFPRINPVYMGEQHQSINPLLSPPPPDPMDVDYPHKCHRCGRKLKWKELVSANPTKLEEHLQELWMSKDVEFYCCFCYGKETVINASSNAWENPISISFGEHHCDEFDSMGYCMECGMSRVDIDRERNIENNNQEV